MPYLDELINKLDGQFGNLGGFKSYAEFAGELCTQTMLRYIVLEQPHGHIEEIYGDTVSARLGHTPIADGWRPSVEYFYDVGSSGASTGVNVKLENISEHIRWVIGGAPQHRIPSDRKGQKKLLFWWGAPHRCPAKDGDDPGARVFKWVNHPGITNQTKNPFVRRAADAAIPTMSTHVKGQVSDYIRDMMNSYGLKEVKA